MRMVIGKTAIVPHLEQPLHLKRRFKHFFGAGTCQSSLVVAVDTFLDCNGYYDALPENQLSLYSLFVSAVPVLPATSTPLMAAS